MREIAAWFRGDEDPHQAVVSRMTRIRDNQANRLRTLQFCAQLYGDTDDCHYSEYASYTSSLEDTDPYPINVIESVVDTLVSEFVQARPRPMYLTTAGDYEIYQRARKLTKFSDGQFDACKVHEVVAPAIAKDGLVLGSAFAKVHSEHDTICVDVVHPSEIYIDRAEGRYWYPREMYQAKYYDRYMAAEVFPESRDVIMRAPSPSGDWAIGWDTTSDQILIVEGWHLPSGPNATDGKRAVCVQGGTLEFEDWNRNNFPFATFFWNRRSRDFWGRSVPEQLFGLQYDINLTTMRIQESQRNVSVPRTWVEVGSQVIDEHINNEIGSIVRYSGTRPITDTPQGLGPQDYQWLERQVQRAFDRVGVSSLAARAERPEGITSGRGLRTLIDTQSKRFLKAARDFEHFHIQLADLMLQEAKEIAKRNPDYEVVYENKRHIEVIKWNEVHNEKDRYVLKCFSTSILPTTPAARTAAVQEMVDSGLMSVEQGQRLLEVPDLEGETSLLTAPREIVELYIERMLDGRPYVAPDSYFNLNLAIYITGLHYLRAKINSVPEEILDNLRLFIEDCKALLATASAPANDASAPQVEPPQVAA